MSKVKKVLGIGITYLGAFIITVIVCSLVTNQGKASGVIQDAGASLPVVYVKAGGRLMNEMHGYIEPVDAGYYRDTITAVGDSKTINLCIEEYDDTIVSASYELYNDQYNEIIEQGDCSEPEKSDMMQQMQLVFHGNLYSNREYCLRIMLMDSEGETINYYTRVRYGSDLKVAEKLKFVLDFNEATFDKDSADELEAYLETSSSASSSDYSLVTLYSSSNMVTWGSMAPYRTSDLSVRLKEINTETAAFTLSYTIESSADDVTTFYNVKEYYRLRWSDTKIWLLDFERQMEEDISLSDLTVSDGTIRIGVGDTDNLELEDFSDEEHSFSYLVSSDQLWLYDGMNHIMTKVYADSDERHNCGREDEIGIKVMHADSESGDLYFAVYGYMHDGNFEGREGVMIYHFSHEDVMLEELVFIPYEKGFEQLKEGIDQLAYMNDEGDIYLMLEDSVYQINAELGRMEVAWTGLNSSNCSASDEGFFVITEGGDDFGGDSLRVINLNTGKEKNIRQDDWKIVPLGFAEDDLIYGLISPDLIARDSNGVMQCPVSEVYIVDSELNEIKSYKKTGKFIMNVSISDGNILLKLGKSQKNGSYTDYTDAGEDYIIRNSASDSSSITLTTKRDSVRGIQNWIQLDTSASFVPITQTARYLDPGYDVTKTCVTSDSVELCYYVYTKGRLAAVFDTIQEAIEYGNTYAGTVMTSHKQVLWQRAGRAYVWDLDVDTIGQVSDTDSLNKVILQAITDMEKWQMPDKVDESLPLFAVLTEYLPAETVDLTGLELTDVLHFVYRDRMVVAKTGDNRYVLIVGYDSTYIQLADPEEGRTYWVTWAAAESMFEAAGNVYYSYCD